MADWIVDAPTDPRAFPRLRHRHANGMLDAVRDRTPIVIQELGGRPIERWTYVCACGDVYLVERPRG